MSMVHDPETIGPLEADGPAELETALTDGAVPIAVYGLGKVGLPMATVFAERTGRVTGVDIDPAVIETVERGEAPFEHEPGLGDLIDATIADESLTVTTDGELAASQARLHVIIVPVGVERWSPHEQAPSWTPEGRTSTEQLGPDLTALETVADTVASGVTPGDLLVVESTVPPGTTRAVVAERLERDTSGSAPIGVAFSPERVASGRAIEDLRGAYPKVVGGVDAASTTAAMWVYQALVDAPVIPVSDARTAEAVKLFEGVYRDVNIALANELARIQPELDIDVREAIDAANSQPYCDIHDPGAGVGGHCIPVYPHLLRAPLESAVPLIERARQVNDRMPGFVTERLLTELSDQGIEPETATIGVFGLTYRAGIPETTNAPAGDIIDRLRWQGMTVIGVDPTLDATEVFGVHRIAPDELECVDLDGAVIVTDDRAFADIELSALDGVVIDCRDTLGEGATFTVGRGSS